MTTLRIASCIRHYRRVNGMTQSQLGQLLGVTPQAVSKWEKQLCCPDITLLPELARLLGVSVAYLLGADEGNHGAP